MSSSLSMARSEQQRSPSLRSIGSSSSIASGVSLSRRPRTRTRSRTVTGGQSPHPDATSTRAQDGDIPFLTNQMVTEPQSDILGSPHDFDSQPPVRPARSPHRPVSTDVQLSDTIGLVEENHENVCDSTGYSVEESPETAMPRTLQQSSLPSDAASTAPAPYPSTFGRPGPEASVNARDSMLSNFTQQTGTSTSLYPPSTSTVSGTESPPSPHSIVETGENVDVPVIDDLQEYDGDDVSYRLRLLVKNNYFLPPAHSKPSASDFASVPSTPRKPTSPTFLDLFRVGKSKSKPTTPVGTSPPPDILIPALRTTSDSITASGYSQYARPQSSSHNPRSRHHGSSPQGRVVVVREKMSDLVGAAKQAEQDMKARGVRRDQGSHRGNQTVFDDVIDPTDAVDLLPPSSKYPFAVQASALHGLGVHDSVGAALLADRLPPPMSPGMSSLDPDDDWRKALLKAAVGHSLDNLNLHQSSPTSIASPMSGPSSPAPVHMLGQRIISNPIILETDIDTSFSRPKSSRSRTSRRGRDHELSPSEHLPICRPPSSLPLRAETPLPLTPLAPPPRRIINPLYSLSQTDLGAPQQSRPPPRPPITPSAAQVVRKSMSSPVLLESYESGAGRMLAMTPPPIPMELRESREERESDRESSFETSREHLLTSVHTESLYSEYAERVNRSSTSLSDYSQPSPTASAFQDALNSINSHSRSTLSQVSIAEQPGILSRASTVRVHAVSPPPPRVSSSLANIALSPPPRSSSLHHRIIPPRDIKTTEPLPVEDTSTTDTPKEILAPSPTTPPFPSPPPHPSPLPERRPGVLPLSLHIPSNNIVPEIQSAPPPSSLTSFFDSIQSQPNAMDDLDSSDESDDEDVRMNSSITQQRPPAYVTRTRTTSTGRSHSTHKTLLMRLGNHSTPYISRPSLPFGAVDPRQPIGHISRPSPFFTEKISRKSGETNHPSLTSSFDFFRYTQEHPGPSYADSSSGVKSLQGATLSESEHAWQHKQRDQESLRRLDGLLIQHMEAEKDRIKRIASNVHASNGQVKS
ncbi:uncharacterized protein BT62DRAFT_990767 [Guyanagaster necrorhizus]|uniref:Uncharacterized protein n=1 Tax=Guyanagaster necrorhizus TaxID=856835 RepID=A0A9P7W2Q7_9AGAR|nr:uncharacterized protein BT62DRAFT_990767 [Guyanagaster necrorhizus MCA 3950]KAG7451118.1 hypothetical protein BT62DRAFT_990767 [Guyanagaster necrorhizus MCA 3950]